MNSGNDAAIPSGVTTDHEGDDRVQQCRVDIGADETPYFAADCNSNGLGDLCDIAAGTSDDVDGDEIPDECRLIYNVTQDTFHTLIQDAIDLSTNGDEIEVPPGTFVENFDLLGKAITLRSTEGPSRTIIDGNANGSVITCQSGEGMNTVIEGFTITNGNAYEGGGMCNRGSSPTVVNCLFSHNVASFSGGGMWNEQSSATVRDCRFCGNSSGMRGGGMWNMQSSPTVTDCTFSSNSSVWGGGMNNFMDSAPTVTGCTFDNNTAVSLGGGMYNRYNSPTLSNCTFRDNESEEHGGGMYNMHCVNLDISNCIFNRNAATFEGGAMFLEDCDSMIRNCTFHDNSAEIGGGIRSHMGHSVVTGCVFGGNYGEERGGEIHNIGDAGLTLSNCVLTGNSTNSDGGGVNNDGNLSFNNCTFSGNSAGNRGGAVFNCGNSSVTNCILWGNTASFGANIYDAYSSEYDEPIVITYSDIESDTPGEFDGMGNISADPLFVDADGEDDIFGTADDNLCLRPGSPCIDSGFSYSMPVDLDGNSRFVDDPDTVDTGIGFPEVIDMGAYEYQGEPSLRGDFNDDGEVSLADYDVLATCLRFSGPGTEPAFRECVDVFDFDGDNNLDLYDFAMFQVVFTGDGY